jgi:hypothetical protein
MISFCRCYYTTLETAHNTSNASDVAIDRMSLFLFTASEKTTGAHILACGVVSQPRDCRSMCSSPCVCLYHPTRCVLQWRTCALKRRQLAQQLQPVAWATSALKEMNLRLRLLVASDADSQEQQHAHAP